MKKGFTLVEMMVAMGLFAVFSLLGAGAFLSSRDQYILDKNTQELVSVIREAQNNAISIRKNGLEDTKVWSVEIPDDSLNDSNSYYVRALYKNGLTLSYATEPVKKGSLNSGVTVDITHPFTISANRVFISFSSPFGFSNITNISCVNTAACNWKESTKATKEWNVNIVSNLSSEVVNNYSAGQKDTILTVKYKSISEKIIVKPNGDVYVQ